MKLIKIMAVALSLVFCLSAFAGCGGAVNYAENNTEYVIGVSGPLTGGAAMYGIAVKNAAQMAVDEINAAGGLNGVKFKLVAMDDMHDAAKISTNYSSLYEGGMQVSLGTVTTAPGLEFKNLSADDNVFFLTPSASGDDIPTNMPTRNTPAQLERLRGLCDSYGMFQISGEDINSPRQSFVIKAMENPMFANLIDATWKLIEHENR